MSGFSQHPSRYPHLSYGYPTTTISYKSPSLATTVTPARRMEIPLPTLVSPIFKPTYHHLQNIPRPPLYPMIQQTMTNLPNPFVCTGFHQPSPHFLQRLSFVRGHGPPIMYRPPTPFVDGRLTLNDVIAILRHCIYNAHRQEVNCPVCGKKYKSKVCLTKHLWEHSMYWSQFQGMKNHERVLCIQTALILTKNPYTSILVTAPFRKRIRDRNPESTEQANDIADRNKSFYTGDENHDAGGQGIADRIESEECQGYNLATNLCRTGVDGNNRHGSVEDFLHFAETVKNTEVKVKSPEVQRTCNKAPPWQSGQGEERMAEEVQNPQQAWFRSDLAEETTDDNSQPLTIKSASLTCVSTSVTTTTTATSTSGNVSKRVSPNNNHSGDSGADDSGYGTSELKKNGNSDEQQQHKSATADIMESNDNKRLADFLEEHQGRPIQSGDDRKIRKFDSESNESSSSCQPMSNTSSSREGERCQSSGSLESTESE